MFEVTKKQCAFFAVDTVSVCTTVGPAANCTPIQRDYNNNKAYVTNNVSTDLNLQMKSRSVLTFLLVPNFFAITHSFGPPSHNVVRRSSSTYTSKPCQVTMMSTRAQPLKSSSSNDEEMFPLLKIVGICGSIGSGKSYASTLLTSKINESTEMTAHHIDTDSLAHGVYAPGSKAIDDVGAEFGESIIVNGTVDRKALGSIVFSDNSKMQVSDIAFYYICNESRFLMGAWCLLQTLFYIYIMNHN